MRISYLLVILLAAVVAADVDLNEQLEKDEIIEAVNSGDSTWQAGRNFNPSLKKSYLKYLFGRKKQPGGSSLPVLVDDGDNIYIPKNFDARKKWKDCKSLQQVRDQGPCGSCWAVSTAAAFADRLCIASKMLFNSHISGEELTSCCTECGEGCNGGYEDKAWEYIQTHGLVTGGDYLSQEGCQPYTLPACEHHTDGKRKNCSSFHLTTPPCKHVCYNKKYKEHSYKDDHHKGKSSFVINNNIKLMQKELLKNGPLVAAFTVYEDFLSYKNGVYQHKTGTELGGHAVKVIGWGVYKKTPYWLVANSWNSDWGDKGFFKIRRGTDECSFEDDVSGGLPVVKN